MQTRKLFVFLAVPVLIGGYFAAEWALGRADAARLVERTRDGKVHSLTVLSETYELDRLYRSMQGPYGNQGGIRLLDSDQDELLWVTGIRTEVVDREGETAVSPEFFCHANLTLAEDGDGPERHNRLFGGQTHLDWRLFTLVPGRLGIELPEGFGIPVRSGESFDFLSMSLNQTVPDRTVHVRFRTRVDFLRDAGLDRKMTPLFRRAVYGYEPVAGSMDPALCVTGTHPGQGCGPFLGVAASKTGFVEALGESRTIHWMVPPGKYESRTSLDDQLDLPFDTTVHYVTAHLHPYGVSITLNDVSTGSTLFTIESRDFEDRLGVEHMGERAFPEGLAMVADHQYELVTLYDNPTDRNVDAMSILYLYLRDRDFGTGDRGVEAE